MERRRFTREFKLEAVRLLREGHRPATEVARELGIGPNLLYKWKRQLATESSAAFPGTGRQTPEAEEIRRLRRELEEAREEIRFLKKTASYFASQRERGSR